MPINCNRTRRGSAVAYGRYGYATTQTRTRSRRSSLEIDRPRPIEEADMSRGDRLQVIKAASSYLPGRSISVASPME